jgi:hypothetical protein
VTDPLTTVFPGLAAAGYRVTSLASNAYNCIAWAASRDDRWWWPHHDAFWPQGVPLSETLAAFEAAYRTLGYRQCATADFELAFEKIGIFADNAGTPKHSARQLESGKWTSKLGFDVDIEHATPDALNGPDYGRPVLFMCRLRPLWRWPVALAKRSWALLTAPVQRAFDQ